MDELMDLASKETGAMPLSNATLGDLSGAATLPRYDRSRLTPGIIHIGVGNFHRAHLAWYVHRLMQQGDATDWGIIGSGVMENDRAMRQNLLAQDCLTTLIELDPEGGQATEIIGSMLDYIPIEDGNLALVQAMADPRIRIVSMTVTEGGYYIDPKTGGLDLSHPDIRHDAAPSPDFAVTIFRATGRSSGRRLSVWRGLAIRILPTGSMTIVPFPTRWLTASCRRPGRGNASLSGRWESMTPFPSRTRISGNG